MTFAEDLAGTEEDFQDYVIVHELLHIRHKGHGRVFKALMTAHVPRWRQIDERMRHTTTRGLDGAQS